MFRASRPDFERNSYLVSGFIKPIPEFPACEIRFCEAFIDVLITIPCSSDFAVILWHMVISNIDGKADGSSL
jgi:hypothetical protein